MIDIEEDYKLCEVMAFFLANVLAEPECPAIPNRGIPGVTAEQVQTAIQSYVGKNECVRFFADLDPIFFAGVFREWQALRWAKGWRE